MQSSSSRDSIKFNLNPHPQKNNPQLQIQLQEINKVLSSPRDIVQERKEKKRQRNIRQRENRKRRKVASLVDHNSVSDTTEERK